MEWRVNKMRTGVYAEYGGYVKGGQVAVFKPGVFMPCFNVQESVRFDSEAAANEYIERRRSRLEVVDESRYF